MTLQEWMATQRGGHLTKDDVNAAIQKMGPGRITIDKNGQQVPSDPLANTGMPEDPALTEAKKFLAAPDVTQGKPGPEMRGPMVPHYVTDAEDPTGAQLSLTQDPGRYVGHLSKGVLESPYTGVKKLLGMVRHPIDTATSIDETLRGIGTDPVGSVKRGLQFANTHPEEVGNLVGESLLAPHMPEAAAAAKTGAIETPGVLGRLAAKTGRGAEALGKSKVAKMASKYGPMEAVFRGDPMGVAAAAIPPVLEYGGKGLQKLGGSMQGLTEALRARFGPETDAANFAKAAAATRQSTEVPGSSYPAVEPNAFTGNGPKAGPGADAPFTHEGFVESLKKSAGVTPEVTNGGLTETPAFKGLQETIARHAPPAETSQFFGVPGETGGPTVTDSDAFRGLQNAIYRSNHSPADEFIANEPQIGVSEGGRTTGSRNPLAEEVFGPGNALDNLSPLDALSRQSGRATSPEVAQALLKKFRGA